jgi:hypothetical protein
MVIASAKNYPTLILLTEFQIGDALRKLGKKPIFHKEFYAASRENP